MIPASYNRRYHDAAHRPPLSGLDDTGGVWLGTSRVVDRADRRRQNKRSWRRLRAEDRRATVAGLTFFRALHLTFLGAR